MLRHPVTIADHNWASSSVHDLLKTIELNYKLYRLEIWPTLLENMNIIEYREYTKMLESLLKKSV